MMKRTAKTSSKRISARSHGSSEAGKPGKALAASGLIWAIIEAAFALALIILVIDFNILPVLYLAIFIVVVAGISAAIFILHRKNTALCIICLVLSVIFTFVSVFGCYYIMLTDKAIDNITGEGVSISVYKAAVKEADTAESLSDCEGYTFGTISYYSEDTFEDAMEALNAESGITLKTFDYSSISELLNGFKSGEVDGIIYESSLGGVFSDLDDEFYMTFKYIGETYVKRSASDISYAEKSEAEVTSETESGPVPESDPVTESETAEESETAQQEILSPFIALISGNDEYFDVSITGRSDVNMLVVVNFSTHQVLLLSIPRDYYCLIPGVSGEDRDKLTHAGIYGMDTLVDAVNCIMDTDIDYYIRVNFTSVCDIIDSVGGVVIQNPEAFTTTYYDIYFPEGELWLDGWQALQFARERKSLENGDFARGVHQQMVIEAMVDKLVSAQSIARYSSLVDAVENCAITNMPEDTIKDIVRNQIENNPDWEILKVQADGEVVYQPSYAMDGMFLSVVMPYKESVDYCKELVRKVYNGEYVTDVESGKPQGQLTYITELVSE